MATMICLGEGSYLNMDHVLNVKFLEEEIQYSESGNVIGEFDEDTPVARVVTRNVAVVQTSIVIDVDNVYSNGYHHEMETFRFVGKKAEVLKMYMLHKSWQLSAEIYATLDGE